MIDSRCPNCGEAFSVPEAMAGQSLTCPKCGSLTTAELPTAVPATTASPTDGDHQPVAQPSKGMAVASLVLGICGFVPMLGAATALLGIILGRDVLVWRYPGRRLAIGGVVTAAVSLLVQVPMMILIGLSSLASTGVIPRRAVCTATLDSIGEAVLLYITDNRGLAPANLQALVDEKFLSPRLLECASNRTRGNVDYFYFRLPDKAPGNSLMACDLKGNHTLAWTSMALKNRKGRNVLLLDGTVKWLSETEFRDELAEPQNADFAKALAEVEGP